MKRLLFAIGATTTAILSLANAAPAKASPTVRALLVAIAETGTTISIDDPQFCKDKGVLGKFNYQKDVIDQLTLCVENHEGDNAELYDTILHESVHVAQACKGSALFDPHSIYQSALAIEVDLVARQYPLEVADEELEARVLARSEDEVFITDLIKKYCL